MRVPVAAELLDLWEAGMAQPTWAWSLTFIQRCFAEEDANALNGLTIGERDARLIEIREAVFGRQLSACSICPSCSARVEMDLQTSDFRVPAGSVTREADFQRDEWRVHFRVPTADDLGVIARGRGVGEMRHALLERCVLSVEQGGRTIDMNQLSADTLDAIVGQMSECDPQADVRFQLRCAECAHVWSEAFDITSYLWSELDAWSQRTLQDIHRLASAYGWRESDVLAVSPQRRSRYLEMIDS